VIDVKSAWLRNDTETMSRETLLSQLAPFGQQHVLRFWDDLDDDQRQRLASQLGDLDLESLSDLIAGKDAEIDFAALAAEATTPPAVGADGSGVDWSMADARGRGEEALRGGEIGAILVAGGQGTRLGFDQPKGLFPIGPVSGRTLFQFFADRLRAIGKKYGVTVPLYVMTSDATDAQTRAYFESNDHLGLDPADVRIFRQGTMPAVDAVTGKLLLAAKDSLAASPDGHGGTVSALDRNGCLQDAADRGIKHLSYIQVDNPLAALCDPELIGHHLMSGSEMTSHVIRKRYPTEKVGNVVSVDSRLQIIEYSDLPQELAEARLPDGALRFWAGSIAVHVFDLAFLTRAAQTSDSLPFHRALKQVEHLDEVGKLVQPLQPNAVKFERFIFDLLPSARNAIVVEALPAEAFAPVKNADGAEADTPSLARAAISDLHRRWLQAAGAVVDSGVLVEINPRYSLTPSDLDGKIPAKLRIESNQYFDS
jgi:UDP-N-acetylglucosamine/UDP-N-acetylgalactosamine diphosphorylase